MNAPHPVSDHMPERPWWTCAADGLPWPCETRQRQMLAYFMIDGGIRYFDLTQYMASWFVVAAGEVPGYTFVGDLHDRFFTWIRVHRHATTRALAVDAGPPGRGAARGVGATNAARARV